MQQIQRPKDSSEVVVHKKKPKKKAKPKQKKKIEHKSLQLSGTLDESRTTGKKQVQPEHPRIGMQIGGYTLVERVGAGGFGEVLRGERQTRNGVQVAAFKFPHDPLDAKVVRSLRHEAKTAKKLDHPNIVCPEKVVDSRSGLYLQMPYVDAQCLDVTEPRAVHECVDLVRKIGKLLSYAHEKGIVHQDTKPENILIDSNGEVHLLDFGLARVKKEQELKLSQETSRPRSLSLTGPIGGTLDYMSPEQKNDGKVDHRADIYGLAVLLYKMLTKGGSPAGRVKKELMKHNVPEQIAAAIEDGGITQLEDRYKTIEEFLSNITLPDEELGVPIEGTDGWWILTETYPDGDADYAHLTYLGKDRRLNLLYMVRKNDSRGVLATDISKKGEKLLELIDKNCKLIFGNVDNIEMEFDDENEILKYKDILEELPRKFKYKGMEVDLEDSIEHMLEFAEETKIKEAERANMVVGPFPPITKGITRADLDRYVLKIGEGNYPLKIGITSGIVTATTYALATGNVASSAFYGVGALVIGYISTLVGALSLVSFGQRAKDLAEKGKHSNTGSADIEIEGTPEEIAEYEASQDYIEVDVEPEGKSQKGLLRTLWDARPKLIYFNYPSKYPPWAWGPPRPKPKAKERPKNKPPYQLK
ncbi:serine/threonine protein kinase [Candidatus Woesearchaeota archaeon]|nr:serine/threonine protein kinase [Candidatus Woesearchaeota archaeon]